MNTVCMPSPWVNPLVLPSERPGVSLRQFTVDDAPDFLDSWRHSEADITRYDPHPSTLISFDCVEDVEEWITQSGRLRMGTWDNGRLVGSGGLHPDNVHAAWMLSFWTDSRETNRGYGFVTAQTLVTYAAGRFSPVLAEVMDENAHSIRIVEKIGMEHTGRKVGALSIFELVK